MYYENEKQAHEIIESLNPFLLTHHCTAGSSFFLSLFDGHPQVLTIPGYVNLIPLFNKEILGVDHGLELFCNTNPYFFNTAEMTPETTNHAGFFHLGENQDEGYSTSKPAFVKYYKEYLQALPINTRNIINALYYSFAKAHDINLSEKKVIIFHPYAHSMAIRFHRIFPGSKALVPVRHPINSFLSAYENGIYKAKIRQQGQVNHFAMKDNLVSLSKHVFPLIEDDIQMIIWRLEDLHQKPKEVLGKLCHYMAIDYHTCLQESTVMGKKYWGHSSDPQKRMSGFSKTHHKRIRADQLSKVQKVLLVTINKQLAKILKYEMPILTFFEKNFALVLFALLTHYDLKWIKASVNGYKKFARMFISERIRLIIFYFKNMHSRLQYKKIRESIIEV